MDGLRAAQLRRALEAVDELGQIDDLAEFPRRTAQVLRRVVPCHHAGYTAVELGTNRATVVADPPDSVFDGGPEVFARFAHQNPLLANLALAGDAPALRLSDFMTRRELHRTDLYHHVYRRIELEYQLGLPLTSPRQALGRPAELVGLSLARTQRDFASEDRLLLDVLRPHLSHILQRLHELALLQATVTASDPDAKRWLLLVEGDGTVVWASPPVTDELGVRSGAALPGELRGWLNDARAAASLAASARGRPRPVSTTAWSRPMTVDGIELRARMVSDAYPGLDAVHLRPLRPLPTVAELKALGLTGRQAQVLQQALAGRTSREIANVLLLSTRTVEKHMDAIYGRLGATNRTEAVLIAARASG